MTIKITIQIGTASLNVEIRICLGSKIKSSYLLWKKVHNRVHANSKFLHLPQAMT